MAALAASQPPAEGLPPPLKPSFAAMVRGTLDHAQETYKEASTYKGEPALHYSEPEVSDLSSPLRFALIGKFIADRPSMEFLRHGFKTIGFKGAVQLGLMDQRHVLIRFDLEEDYHRCWLHSTWRFRDHLMKVLKWTPDFSVKEEPPVVPVWVSLDQLPLFLFARSPLFSIGRLLGKPLKLDAATISLSRPSVARLCVEVDLRQPLPSRLWIGLPKGGFWQPIKYENLPAYCFECCSLGHLQSDCGKQLDLHQHPTQVWRVKSLAAAVDPAKASDSTHIASTSQPVSTPSPNVAPVAQDPGLISTSAASVQHGSQSVVAFPKGLPADATVTQTSQKIGLSPVSLMVSSTVAAPVSLAPVPVPDIVSPVGIAGDGLPLVDVVLASASLPVVNVAPQSASVVNVEPSLSDSEVDEVFDVIDQTISPHDPAVGPTHTSLLPVPHVEPTANQSGFSSAEREFMPSAVPPPTNLIHDIPVSPFDDAAPQAQGLGLQAAASSSHLVASAGCTVAPPLHETVRMQPEHPSALRMSPAASVPGHAASTVAQLELLPTPLSAESVQPSFLQPSYKHVLVDNSWHGIPSDAIVVSQNRHTNATIAASHSALSMGPSSLLQLPHAPAFDTGYGYGDSDYYQDTLVSDDFGHGDYEDTDEHTYTDITDGSEGTLMTKRKDRRKLKGGASNPPTTINDFTAQSRLLDIRIRKRGHPPGS